MLPPPLVSPEANMDFDDDDGMPPLVDNPLPLPPLTFTFSAQLPPISYAPDVTHGDGPPELVPADLSFDSPPGTPMLGPARASHAKRRDASYIPRPPNAFILFRSSFIRAQHIPGAIEGNHSALSKIIGKCWKALPREEREQWEAKAIVALAEHRRKYPDWRFKPAANALAKVKDGPRKRGNRKGRGQSEKEERSREKRCAKIADLLVAGKTGSDLAAAVEQYDCETGRGRKLKDESAILALPQAQAQVQEAARGGGGNALAAAANGDVVVQVAQAPSPPALAISVEPVEVKPLAPRSAVDGRFKVPLTAMFKRSSSAPAPRARTPPPGDMLQLGAGPRRDSFSAAPPSYTRATSLDSLEGVRGAITSSGFDRSAAREGSGHAPADSVSSSIQTFSPGVAAPVLLPRTASAAAAADGVNDAQAQAHAQAEVDAFGFAAGAFASPPLPEFEPDGEGEGLSSPAASPIATPVLYSWGQESDIGSPTSISDMMGEAYAAAPSPSSYSSLEGWAGSPLPRLASPISSPLAKVYHYAMDGGPASPGVMEKAFDAAACAVYGEWNERCLPSAAGPALASASYAWGGPEHAFESYAFPAVQCRQDGY